MTENIAPTPIAPAKSHKKRRLLFRILLVVAAFLLLLWILCYWFVRPLYIDNDHLYFDMSPRALTRRKGSPASIETFGEVGAIEYHYTETLYGYEASTAYWFVHSHLTRFYIYIDSIDYESAMKIVKKITKKQARYYSLFRGYYFDEETDGSNAFQICLVVSFNSGAVINFDYTYESGVLSIDAEYLS